jgi:hypothetical protein
VFNRLIFLFMVRVFGWLVLLALLKTAEQGSRQQAT